MKKPSVALLSVFAISACAVVPFNTIPTDRTGYSDGWYYERLTPYYENNLYLEPRVHFRAVGELVGIPTTFDNGFEGHVDVLRQDIELFFAMPIPDLESRIALAQLAIRETCPLTDLTGLQDKIEYSNQTYVVLQNVPCDGHAS